VIEQDQRSGAFIYKTVDPRSHEVLSQYPTEDLLKLRERPDYVPGAVVQQKI
jgi:flagellar protein FlaG